MTLSSTDREKLVRIVTDEVKKYFAQQGRTAPPRPGSISAKRKVVHEAVVREALRCGQTELRVASKAIITPAARELAEAKGLRILDS